MNWKSFAVISILSIFLLASLTLQGFAAKEIRIRGGHADDFKDSKGRVWSGAQKEYKKDDWGGWVGKLPQTAEVATLTDAAKTKAKNAGYDEALFYAVSWAAFPDTVKFDINTGSGAFDVTYLVGEHWSPNNRGFDIFIEGENVLPLYVTPGSNEIDIKTFAGMKVSDGVMSFNFAGNAETKAGDLNAMFSALEIISSTTPAVQPGGKLTGTWATIKVGK
ncbi:hypothetical protein FJZ31_00610 [Candidatus Poribacteria bacterium]|nr:hypothetical protein [Candidatus Poribacteria bacterium]